MSLLRKITRLVQDPPPAHIFELSEAGIAYAVDGQRGFAELPQGTLSATPLRDNLLKPDEAARVLDGIAPMNGNRKRRPAALILPDHAARVSLLDFDTLPSAAEEQLALVRFRVKKTIPFDIDSAAVKFWSQPGSGKGIDVVAVTVSLEILARYEALFRSAGYHPGQVTTSALAALELYNESGVAVIAKLAGHVLTVIAVADGRLELFRCLEIGEANERELLEVLQPTFVFVEDELSRPVAKLVVCGLPQEAVLSLDRLNVPVEPLRSQLGAPGAYNAGLLGYLEGTRN